MSLTIQTLSGTSNKESTGLMDPIQSSKMQISTVEQISGAGFPDQFIHDAGIVDAAAGDDHHSGNIAAQVEQRMELHCGFAASELSPRKKRQTQIDDGGVHRIDGLLQFQTKGFIRIQLTSFRYQELGEVGVDPPIAHVIRMRERIARNSTANTHVIQLGGSSSQTRFNISKTLAISQLCKSHCQKLIPRRKALDFVIAAVSLNTQTKFIARNKVHQLRKDRLTSVHRRPPSAKLPKEQLRLGSNR